MKILAFFTSSGTPATGLTPTIRIRELDGNTLVVTDAAMTEVGDGHYQYEFTTYDKDVDYAIRCDGGITLSGADRYTYAGNENYIDDISDTVTESTSAAFEYTNELISDTNLDVLSLSASNQANFDTVNNNIDDVDTQVRLVSGAVWDEPLTGHTHNIPTTSGRRLRALASTVITDGTADGNGNGYNQIVLNGDALTTDGAYDPAMIAIVNGNGAGQCRNIFQYDGSTKTATVDRNWKIQPDNTSEYVIYADAGREHVNEGLARGGTTNTITLNELAASGCDAYVGQAVFIRSGYGDDQVRLVIAYDPVTKIATVEYPWNCIPDTTSAYVMIPYHIHPPDEIRDFVWNTPTSGYGVSGGTYGNLIQNSDTRIQSLSASNQANFDALTTIVNAIPGDVWDQLLADHTIAGSFGAELATKADVQAAFSTNDNLAVSGGLLEGTNVTGSYLDTFARDSVYWEIQEDAATGIIVEFVFNIPEDDRAGVFQVFGRYIGTPGTTHYMDVDAYNYEAGTWENLVDEFMPGGNTSDSLYQIDYSERHIDRDNLSEVRIRLRHHTTTYNVTHELFLDFVNLTSIDVTTATDIATAVWSANPSGYSGLDSFGGIINTISEDLKRLLGLTHENIFIDNPTYDGDCNMTSARVRIYSNPASVGTNSDVIGTYTITAPSSAPGKFITWSQVRI